MTPKKCIFRPRSFAELCGASRRLLKSEFSGRGALRSFAELCGALRSLLAKRKIGSEVCGALRRLLKSVFSGRGALRSFAELCGASKKLQFNKIIFFPADFLEISVFTFLGFSMILVEKFFSYF